LDYCPPATWCVRNLHSFPKSIFYAPLRYQKIWCIGLSVSDKNIHCGFILSIILLLYLSTIDIQAKACWMRRTRRIHQGERLYAITYIFIVGLARVSYPGYFKATIEILQNICETCSRVPPLARSSKRFRSTQHVDTGWCSQKVVAQEDW
jgi:hypothetical protein